MMRDSNVASRARKNTGQNIIFLVLGAILVIWLGLIITPAFAGDRMELLQNLSLAINSPFDITWVDNNPDSVSSPKMVLMLLVGYGFSIGVYLSTKRNYRRREEHGSAKWGDAKSICKVYKDKEFTSNKILTQNVRIGFDVKRHRRNLNVLICGGSGAGKTRFYAKPNVMQANSSKVILDPKGEILRDTGHLLEQQGVKVRVLDLINMNSSYCYNPFVYIKDDTDVQRLVTNLFKATTPKNAASQDPFWDYTASMLLSALIFYLHYEAPKDEQNFGMVMEMLRAGEVREDDEGYRSPLDDLFASLEFQEPNHIAVKYYSLYRKGSGKTLKSIQITLASKLEKFNLEEMEKLTNTDELDIIKMGEEKTALFIVIPDSDTSFNFLVSILYTQLFQTLFYQADHVHKGSLPNHVHFVMDEFANVCLPDDFEKDLSTMRSRGVSVSIILQNLAQLKALFEKQWESIVGNCDEFLYLGGNEQSTHKHVSELLGKETLDHNTFGKSTGRNANYSTNYQISGRELLTPDEVRLLDNRYAILFIRGERAIIDEKFDIMKHPNVGATADGNGIIYEHGLDSRSIGSVQLIGYNHELVENGETSNSENTGDEEITYELYSEMDIEYFYYEKELRHNESVNTQERRGTPDKRKPKPTDESQDIFPKRRHVESR